MLGELIRSEVIYSAERRLSRREPADSPKEVFNVIGGWLPSLTSPLR
jgi:hypothetical protein